MLAAYPTAEPQAPRTCMRLNDSYGSPAELVGTQTAINGFVKRD